MEFLRKKYNKNSIIKAIKGSDKMPISLKRMTKLEEIPHVRLLESDDYNTIGYQCLESYKPISLLIKVKL